MSRLGPAFAFALLLPAAARGAEEAASASSSTALGLASSLHFQTTVITQSHGKFSAAYTGPHSLPTNPENDTSITSTLFLGLRLRPGTEVYLDPEVSGGKGIGNALGIAGFANGEIFRVGDPSPTLTVARLYLQQVVGLGERTEEAGDGPNQVGGPLPEERLVLRAGRFSLADYFDDNAYSHDPRTQFMNWALMSSGAWDYPADTRGYTWGLTAELRSPEGALRAAAVQEPLSANELQLDPHVFRAHGLTVEGERALRIGGRRGTTRLLLFLNEARMGSYQETLDTPGFGLDVTRSRGYTRTKYGFASSSDLELSDALGVLLRLSWNDGRNESWAFTEIDRSGALGLEWKPAGLGRPRDRWGLAQVVNGLSGDHRRYLEAGGEGFILGDGALNYGPELVTETYYKLQCGGSFALSPDVQFIVNPGFNRDRGPVLVWGLRLHEEF